MLNLSTEPNLNTSVFADGTVILSMQSHPQVA